MKRASIAATVYLLALFALGFILGTIRVLLFVAPRIEVLGATLDEVPLMLTAAFFISRWQLAAGAILLRPNSTTPALDDRGATRSPAPGWRHG